jgi:hypothetical protein
MGIRYILIPIKRNKKGVKKMKIDYSSKSYEDLVLDAEIYNQLIEEANQRAKIAEGCDKYAEKRIEAMTISLLSIREEIKKREKLCETP